ncbi:MAG: DUF6452 family protein [Bacteroidales bacterium]
MKYYSPVYCIFLSIFLTILNFCTPQSCQEETETLVGASFYKTGTGKMEAPDTVTIYGIGKESSLLYNNAFKKSVLFLPLDAGNDKCFFIVKINSVTDTLSFIYTTFPHLISKECGYTYFHNITECNCTGNIIDTVIVMNKRITERNEENLRIFY